MPLFHQGWWTGQQQPPPRNEQKEVREGVQNMIGEIKQIRQEMREVGG